MNDITEFIRSITPEILKDCVTVRTQRAPNGRQLFTLQVIVAISFEITDEAILASKYDPLEFSFQNGMHKIINKLEDVGISLALSRQSNKMMCGSNFVMSRFIPNDTILTSPENFFKIANMCRTASTTECIYGKGNPFHR